MDPFLESYFYGGCASIHPSSTCIMHYLVYECDNTNFNVMGSVFMYGRVMSITSRSSYLSYHLFLLGWGITPSPPCYIHLDLLWIPFWNHIFMGDVPPFTPPPLGHYNDKVFLGVIIIYETISWELEYSRARYWYFWSTRIEGGDMEMLSTFKN